MVYFHEVIVLLPHRKRRFWKGEQKKEIYLRAHRGHREKYQKRVIIIDPEWSQIFIYPGLLPIAIVDRGSSAIKVRPTLKELNIVSNARRIEFPDLTFPSFGGNLNSIFTFSHPKTRLGWFFFIPEYRISLGVIII